MAEPDLTDLPPLGLRPQHGGPMMAAMEDDMAGEITHRTEADGRYRQIVSPRRLREILDRDGDDYSKPSWMRPDDEWFVVDQD
jgi:hypothetical protein